MSEQRVEVVTLSAGDSRSVGRVLVLPGRGYTVDHPLLFWACQVLADLGWHVDAVR